MGDCWSQHVKVCHSKVTNDVPVFSWQTRAARDPSCSNCYKSSKIPWSFIELASFLYSLLNRPRNSGQFVSAVSFPLVWFGFFMYRTCYCYRMCCVIGKGNDRKFGAILWEVQRPTGWVILLFPTPLRPCPLDNTLHPPIHQSIV